eukprot:1156377-Pelagomonas_calceolata.AAC.1
MRVDVLDLCGVLCLLHNTWCAEEEEEEEERPERGHYGFVDLLKRTAFDLVRPKPNNTTDPHPRADTAHSPSTPSIPPLVLPEVYTLQVACIYGTDGKCKGMLTLERINILHTAFDRAKHNGMHDTIQPHHKSFASELMGLFSRSILDNTKHQSKKIKDSYVRILPNHVHTAMQRWALVTQQKMASPLDYNPNHLHYWSEHPRDKVFGAIHNALSSKFSGFSTCHPICDDHVMYLTLKHAIYSATQQSHATATFMFLPSWGGPMSTNPYSKRQCLSKARHPSQLLPEQRHVHLVEVKYFKDTRLQASKQQHRDL